MTIEASPAPIPRDWARAIVDREAFEDEQRRLAHTWTFLGLTTDLANNGDWFRASIATRSVFVQRFGDELRGFENVCVHRFYPLRNADRGNGPIICGFHQWQYDREGRLVGVPMCRDLFGKTPHQLGARLTPIELATCGSLIFGRFSRPDLTESLEDFLADGFSMLKTLSQVTGQPRFMTSPIAANWRLCLHITLDDYHTVAIHPSTLGRRGYVKPENVTYHRFGLHSAYLWGETPQSLDAMRTTMQDGTFQPSGYSIFHVMPNLLVVLFHTDGRFWNCLVQCYDPIQYDRSAVRTWFYPAPFATGSKWLRKLTDPVRMPIVAAIVRRIGREDVAVCEQIQTVAHQIGEKPLLGGLEERIDWFEQSYRQMIGGDDEAREEPAS